MANNVVKIAQEYPEIDLMELQIYIDNKNIAMMNKEARMVAKRVVEIRKDEKALSALIPNVHEWKKQFTSAELHAVFDAVEKKLDSISDKSLMEQVKLLNKEITYVSTPDYLKPHKLYPTWEVSQAAYMKQLDKVQDTLDWEIISDSLVGITAFKTKSKPYLDLVDVLQEAVSKKDKTLAKQTILDIQKKRAELDKAAEARMRKRMQNIKPTDLPDMTKEEIERLLDDFENNLTMDDADKLLRGISENVWATLTEEERKVVTKYTQTYCYLNEPLRGIPYYGSLIPNEDHLHDLPILTAVLDKVKAPQNMVVRRGVNNFIIKELGYDLSGLKAGDVFVDKAFLSTAVQRHKGFNQQYEFIICVPKGAKGIYAEPFSHYTDYGKFNYEDELWDGKSVESIGGEAEWIGQRGSQFKVLKRKGKKIYLQMIGQMQ